MITMCEEVLEVYHRHRPKLKMLADLKKCCRWQLDSGSERQKL